MESFGIFWNLLESFGFLWNFLESFGFFQKFLESFGFFQNLLESLSSLVGLGLRSSLGIFKQLGWPRTQEFLEDSWSILGALGLESISSLVSSKLQKLLSKFI